MLDIEIDLHLFLFTHWSKIRGVAIITYVRKTAHLHKLQGSVPRKFLQVCQFCNLDHVSCTLTHTPLRE